MQKQITLYGDIHKLSPYVRRVELALLEAGATFKTHRFDFFTKPAWFVGPDGVNPYTGKIPAITYGGPEVPPEEPSPLSAKITESHVILEFIADVFPSSQLLPSDPVSRAHVRFIMTAANNLEGSALEFFHGASEAYQKLLDGLEAIQKLLPDEGEFAVGEHYTIADASITPILRLVIMLAKTNAGKFDPDLGTKLAEELRSEKLAKLRKYGKGMMERENFKKAVDVEHEEFVFKQRFGRSA
ncbi:hypothetical protein F5I97DRAFT_1932241 [Phlebopus sp. FC_14]|nr:hypothetical protein F5I97DRAFT_1932241 [Phlebopus sp. FC_14]